MGELMTKMFGNTSALAVRSEETYVIVPLHDRFKWNGPFDSKEEAQRAAVQWLIQTGWMSVGIFKIVGTVTRPIPELEWHEPDSSKV